MIRYLVEERERRPFSDLMDFCTRMRQGDLNKRVMEGLIKSGALDGFGFRRRQLLLGYEALLESIDKENRQNLSGQINLFDLSDEPVSVGKILPEVEEFDPFPAPAAGKGVHRCLSHRASALQIPQGHRAPPSAGDLLLQR